MSGGQAAGVAVGLAAGGCGRIARRRGLGRLRLLVPAEGVGSSPGFAGRGGWLPACVVRLGRDAILVLVRGVTAAGFWRSLGARQP